MKEWIIKWFQTFWENHGERIFFSSIASFFGVCFIITGTKVPALKEFVGAGTTILIGVGMLFFNKTRSPENKKEVVVNEEIT